MSADVHMHGLACRGSSLTPCYNPQVYNSPVGFDAPPDPSPIFTSLEKLLGWMVLLPLYIPPSVLLGGVRAPACGGGVHF